MNINLETIIKGIGTKYSIKIEKINEIITKLNNEFFFELEDMKYKKLDLWTTLGLPINIYNKIMEKYESYTITKIKKNKKNIESSPKDILTTLPKENLIETSNLEDFKIKINNDKEDNNINEIKIELKKKIINQIT